ncbi:FHA domain-containing protein, partial [Kitasatospora sp. NPDC001574]
MPQLVIEINGQQRTLEPGRSYTIGRNPQSDFPFDDARVSWHHATISFNGAGWQLDDHGSTNGTYTAGARTMQAQLFPGAVVNLGNAENGPRLSFSAPAQAAAQAPAWHEAATSRSAAPEAHAAQQQ